MTLPPAPRSDLVTLFTAPLSMFGMNVEIALREKGISFERVSVPYDAVAGYAPKHPQVVRANPKQQVPVLVNGSVSLFDSTQIFEYLEDAWPALPLWPQDVGDRARCRKLELLADEVYFTHIIKLMSLQTDWAGNAAKTAIAAAQAFYLRMESTLRGRQFLCGEFSFADIGFFMAQLFGERMGAPMSSSTPQLLEWRHRIASRASVGATLRPMVAFLREANRPAPDYIVAPASA